MIVEYFFEQRPQQEIAASLGVTPSRVSQLLSEALRMLNAALRDHLRPQAAPTRARRTARMAVVTDGYVRAVATRSTVGGRLDATTTLGDEYRRPVRQRLGA